MMNLNWKSDYSSIKCLVTRFVKSFDLNEAYVKYMFLPTEEPPSSSVIEVNSNTPHTAIVWLSALCR